MADKFTDSVIYLPIIKNKEALDRHLHLRRWKYEAITVDNSQELFKAFSPIKAPLWVYPISDGQYRSALVLDPRIIEDLIKEYPEGTWYITDEPSVVQEFNQRKVKPETIPDIDLID